MTYTFCVINTGQTPLSKLTVHDLSLGRVVCTNPVGQDSLLPGDGCSCQTTAQIVTDTINVATVVGVPLQVDGQPIPGANANAADWEVVTVLRPGPMSHKVYLPLVLPSRP